MAFGPYPSRVFSAAGGRGYIPTKQNSPGVTRAVVKTRVDRTAQRKR